MPRAHANAWRPHEDDDALPFEDAGNCGDDDEDEEDEEDDVAASAPPSGTSIIPRTLAPLRVDMERTAMNRGVSGDGFETVDDGEDGSAGPERAETGGAGWAQRYEWTISLLLSVLTC